MCQNELNKIRYLQNKSNGLWNKILNESNTFIEINGSSVFLNGIICYNDSELDMAIDICGMVYKVYLNVNNIVNLMEVVKIALKQQNKLIQITKNKHLILTSLK